MMFFRYALVFFMSLLIARAGNIGGGGAGAPADATFITQTPNAALTNGQALSALATGLLKNATGTGVLSIAAVGVDYLSPAAIGMTIQAWDADLDTIAGLSKADGNFIVGDGANWTVESGATARASLGLGSLAVINDAPSDGSQYARKNGAWDIVIGNVSSVFGRTGAVVAVAGDYTASLVDNVPAGSIGSLTVQGAINELDSDITTLAGIVATKQPLDATLTAFAALTGAADKLPYFTALDTFALADLSAFARSFLDDATEAAFKATVNLEIGVDVQAWDADLDTIAGLAKTDGNFIVGDGAAWVVESGATARTSLGLGTIATQNANNVTISGGSITGITDLAIADGGTGQSTAQAAINALTAVAGATNEHVLTKDTATGNAIFKAAPAAGAPVGAKYIVQQADGTLTNEQALDALATGLLKSTTTTGVLSIGVAGTDYPGLAFANIFTAAQTIDGSADVVQLTVKAHSTQNEDIFQLVNDAGVKVLGIRESAGYCRFTTDVSNDNYWFTEGFSVSDGANIFNVNSGGAISFLSGGHIGINDTGGGRYVQFRSDKRVGFGDNFTPGATLEVRQASASGGIPVLWLKQADTTQEIIRLEATVGAGNPIDTAALGAYYGKVRVKVEGVGAKWLALYD